MIYSKDVIEYIKNNGIRLRGNELKNIIETVEYQYNQIDILTKLLDETDEQDFFGTEGWRHHIGVEDEI